MNRHHSGSASAGHTLPSAVGRYYAAVDAGAFGDAASAFAHDGVLALPRPGSDEIDAPLVAQGRPAMVPLLELARRPLVHDALVCARASSDSFVEGVVREPAGTPVGTFIDTFSLAPDGRIVRHVGFGCEPAVEPLLDPPGATADVDASVIVGRYFSALHRGAFEEATACFSEDVIYSHPPYRHPSTARRATFHGRAQLLAHFERRGRRGFHHDVLRLAQADQVPAGGHRPQPAGRQQRDVPLERHHRAWPHRRATSRSTANPPSHWDDGTPHRPIRHVALAKTKPPAPADATR